jgi:hypothetical protein
MTAIDFSQANKYFGPPAGLEESQVRSIPAFVGDTTSGSVDGVPLVVVAWQPSFEDLELMKQGKPIFITMMGGLAPHYLSMSFEQATHPA